MPARTDQFDPTVPAGQIISLTPAAGTEVPRDSTVSVVVSRGPAVVVPAVIGQPLAQAIATLQAAGLVIVETSGNGGVLSTDPPRRGPGPDGSGRPDLRQRVAAAGALPGESVGAAASSRRLGNTASGRTAPTNAPGRGDYHRLEVPMLPGA